MKKEPPNGPVLKNALRAALPRTLPVLTGYLFLGMTYGVYMNVSGFPFWYPMLMSIVVFAGSAEFVAVSLLLGPFAPLQAFLVILMLNARHLFYGISMLDKYKGLGLKKLYLIYALTDETFSVNCSAELPENVDRGLFYLPVTVLDHCYWVTGATLGGVLGSLVTFSTKGLDFVMTAMFVVIFLDRWLKEKSHISALLGLGLTLVCLIVFGPDRFLVPAMGAILLSLTLLRRPLERRAGDAV